MIIDIVIILLIALAGFVGYKKGFVDMIASIVSIILAFILAIVLQEAVADFLIEKTGLGSNIENQIEDTLKNALIDEDASKSQEVENGENIESSEQLEANTKKQNVEIKGFIENFVKEEIIADNIPIIANNITKFIFKGISFIGIFIIVIIITYIIRMILNLVFELPILSTVNKFGGLAFGVIKGLLWIFILFAIIKFLEPMGVDKVVVDYINTSIVSKFLYDTNFVVMLIKGDLKF